MIRHVHRRPAIALLAVALACAALAAGVAVAARLDVARARSQAVPPSPIAAASETAPEAAPVAADPDIVMRQLAEVQRGTLDGLDYFTITIVGAPVGPADCRGTILRIDIDDVPSSERREAMEQVALGAMLAADSVMITVPSAPDACVDGRPTFTRVDLLPAYP